MTVTVLSRQTGFEANSLGLPGNMVIDRRIYFDEAVYQREIETIFKKTWQFAGHESELKSAGDFVAVDVADQRILVTRGKDGAPHAFYNVCTHRGAALTMARTGNCKNAFRCMYHGWSFDLTGKLTGMARPSHHSGLEREALDIPPVRVESRHGFIFVNLDAAAVSLDEFLGDAAQLLHDIAGSTESLGRVSFMVDGNWKLWSENFRDGYHPEYTHPLVGAYYQEVDRSSGTIVHSALGHSRLWWPMEGNPRNIGMRMESVLGDFGRQFESPGTRAAPPAHLDFSKGSAIVAVFPNLDVQNLMGGAEQCIQAARPISVDKTRVDLWVLGDKGESEEVRRFRMMKSLDAQGSSGKVSGDDCEASARITHAIRADPVRWTPLTRGDPDTEAGQKTEDQAIRGFYQAWHHYTGL